MNKQLRDDWVKALRSGEYVQTSEALQKGDAFCCLGVLCEVAATHGFKPKRTPTGNLSGLNLSAQPNKIDSLLLDWQHDAVVGLNDDGKEFPIIADWIEKNIPVDSAS